MNALALTPVTHLPEILQRLETDGVAVATGVFEPQTVATLRQALGHAVQADVAYHNHRTDYGHYGAVLSLLRYVDTHPRAIRLPAGSISTKAILSQAGMS